MPNNHWPSLLPRLRQGQARYNSRPANATFSRSLPCTQMQACAHIHAYTLMQSALLYVGDYNVTTGPFIALLTIDNPGSIVAPTRVTLQSDTTLLGYGCMGTRIHTRTLARTAHPQPPTTRYRPISGLAILGNNLYAAVSDEFEQKLFVRHVHVHASAWMDGGCLHNVCGWVGD